MLVFIIKFFVSGLLWAIGLLCEEPYTSGFIISAITCLLLTIVEIIISVCNNWKYVKFYTKIQYLKLKKQNIRFSMSYQYIIKVNDRYLLVKNSHWNKYQLVGGKYKQTPNSKNILNKLEAQDDIKMPTNSINNEDLAVFIPAKNAIKFLKWFDEGKDREVSHWREFYEELIKNNVLPKENFPYVNYNFCKSIRTPLKRTPAESGWHCWELLHYDILELIPNSDQQEELSKIQNRGDTDYLKWADIDLVNHLGHDNRKRAFEYNIAQHAKWMINKKWEKE